MKVFIDGTGCKVWNEDRTQVLWKCNPLKPRPFWELMTKILYKNQVRELEDRDGFFSLGLPEQRDFENEINKVVEMKKYIFSFTGKQKGNMGSTSYFTEWYKCTTLQEAVSLVNEDYESITGLTCVTSPD